MKKLATIAASIILAGCGEAPEDLMLRQANAMSELVWACQEKVLAGAELLRSENCRKFAEEFQAFDEKNRELEEMYRDSFEFKIRDTLGWKLATLYPCNNTCLKAHANAGWAAARFRRTITISQGCHHALYGDWYFDEQHWDDIERKQERSPCRRRLEGA